MRCVFVEIDFFKAKVFNCDLCKNMLHVLIYSGIFGQKNNWSPNDLLVSPGHRLPDDIRREGSAMTLKVLNAGGNSRWVQR